MTVRALACCAALAFASAACGGNGGTGGGTAATATGAPMATGAATGGATASSTAVTPPSAPSVEVALVWSVDGSSRLWLCDTGPARCRPASDEEKAPPAGDASLAWSPDGKHVVFGTAELLRFVDGATGTPWKVAPGRRASYSPDGRTIAIVDRAGVSLVDADLGGRRLLARSSADGAVPDELARYDAVYGWSADGQRIAVSVAYYEGSGVEILAVPDGAPLSETPHWSAAFSTAAPNHLFVAAFDKVAGYADDGLWWIDLAATGKKAGPKRLGEAGEALLIGSGDTLLTGYAEAGSFTRAPEAWRPRGILAGRVVARPPKKGGPELQYRRVIATSVRAVPLGLSTDGRMLLFGSGGAAGLFESIRWADLVTGETGPVPVPPGEGKVLAAALRPDPRGASAPGDAGAPGALEAAWARGTPVLAREGELWLAGAPPSESAPIVKPLPIPWPASWPSSMPYGTGAPGGTGAPAGTGAPTETGVPEDPPR